PATSSGERATLSCSGKTRIAGGSQIIDLDCPAATTTDAIVPNTMTRPTAHRRTTFPPSACAQALDVCLGGGSEGPAVQGLIAVSVVPHDHANILLDARRTARPDRA